MDYVRFHRFVTRTYVCIRALSVSIYLYIYMAIWLYGVLAKCSDRICYIVARVVCVVCMYVL